MNNSIHLIILSIAVLAGGYYVYKELNKLKKQMKLLEDKDVQNKEGTQLSNTNIEGTTNTLVSEQMRNSEITHPQYEYTDNELTEGRLERDFANFSYESDTGESDSQEVSLKQEEKQVNEYTHQMLNNDTDTLVSSSILVEDTNKNNELENMPVKMSETHENPLLNDNILVSETYEDSLTMNNTTETESMLQDNIDSVKTELIDDEHTTDEVGTINNNLAENIVEMTLKSENTDSMNNICLLYTSPSPRD